MATRLLQSKNEQFRLQMTHQSQFHLPANFQRNHGTRGNLRYELFLRRSPQRSSFSPTTFKVSFLAQAGLTGRVEEPVLCLCWALYVSGLRMADFVPFF